VGLLDFIFPKFCINCKRVGEYLCANCFSYLSFDTKNICLPCGKPSFDGLTHPKCRGNLAIDGSFTGIVFNKVAKKMVYQIKYRPYLSGLSDFAAELLFESLIQNEEFNKTLKTTNLILTPVPLSSEKLRKRGYNQAELIAINLSKRLNLPFETVLTRTKNTSSQVGLSKRDRKLNVRGVFSTSADVSGRNFLVIDDVLTSGATLFEAGKVLKEKGAVKVWGVAFARER
jgi:competence protein ComFC